MGHVVPVRSPRNSIHTFSALVARICLSGTPGLPFASAHADLTRSSRR